jgi:chromate transport protein ChrA
MGRREAAWCGFDHLAQRSHSSGWGRSTAIQAGKHAQLASDPGWLMHGIPGGLIAGVLFLDPSVLVLTALASAYALWGQLPLLVTVFGVLKPAVLAIVLVAAAFIALALLRLP